MNIYTYNYFNSVSKLSTAIASANQVESSDEQTVSEAKRTEALKALNTHVNKNVIGQKSVVQDLNLLKQTATNQQYVNTINTPISGFVKPTNLSHPENLGAVLVALSDLEDIRINPQKAASYYQEILESTAQTDVLPEEEKEQKVDDDKDTSQSSDSADNNRPTTPSSSSSQSSSSSSSSSKSSSET